MPFLFKKAKQEGIIFSNAVSQCSWTKPSVMTVFTGLYPNQHKAENFYAVNYHKTLPELLQEQNYYTACFNGIYTWTTNQMQNGSMKGFNEFYSCHFTDINLISRTINFLMEAKQSNKNWFVYLHLMGAHGRNKFPNNPSKEVLKKIVEDYNAQVKATDFLLKELFKEIDFSCTQVILFGDHGEEFLENGHLSHGKCLCNELVFVPLIEFNPFKKAKVNSNLVELVDITATVLEKNKFNESINLSLSNKLSVFSRVWLWAGQPFLPQKVLESKITKRYKTLTSFFPFTLNLKEFSFSVDHLKKLFIGVFGFIAFKLKYGEKKVEEFEWK